MIALLLFSIVAFTIFFSVVISFKIKFGSKTLKKQRVAASSSEGGGGDCQRDIIDISSYRCCQGSSSKYIDSLELTVSPTPLENVVDLCGNICTEGINPDDPTKCNSVSSGSNQTAYTECLSLYRCGGINTIIASSNTVPYYAQELGRSAACAVAEVQCEI